MSKLKLSHMSALQMDRQQTLKLLHRIFFFVNRVKLNVY